MAEASISPEAYDDLVDAVEMMVNYLSEARIRIFVRAVFTTADSLVKFPGLSVRCPDSPLYPNELRRIPVGRFDAWLLFYLPTGSGIRVVRILPSNQDWPRLLRP